MALGGVIRPGWLEIEGEVILATSVEQPRRVVEPDLDLGTRLVAPGFVDIHVHGGGGSSFDAGGTAARCAAAFHRSHGTTTVLASLVSAPIERLVEVLADLEPLVDAGVLAGIHLEGPFLAAERCGAHRPELLRPPSPGELERLMHDGPEIVRMVTIAPELTGGVGAVRQLVARGIVAAIGHTAASYAVAAEAIVAGASVATHLFNAMAPLLHREPGPVLACLEAPSVAMELIADGVHLHPALVAWIFSVAPSRVVLVTDAIAAAGVGDGQFDLAGSAVTVRDGAARLDRDGSLAGSLLTLDAALRNVVDAGVPLAVALHALTTAPARAAGLDGVAGVLKSGRRADVVVLDEALEVDGVLAAGAWVRRPSVGADAQPE
jgi:N-acetylglucosamine-6-phosphate deacetylase